VSDRKLYLDPSGAARLDRRHNQRIPSANRVFDTLRYIKDSVAHTTDSDDVIVARAKQVLRG
jgi:hypothetical protein